MRILICDDERCDSDSIERSLSSYLSRKNIQCDITTESSPKNVIANGLIYDIAFLDIQMGEVSGIDLAKKLTERNKDILLFFVSGYKNLMDSAMDIRPFRYFDKPVAVERLNASLDRAFEQIRNSSSELFAINRNTSVRIMADEIIYLTITGRKTQIVTINGSFPDDRSIEQWESDLNSPYFARIHKSFIVNLRNIKKCNYLELTMIDGREIQIASRRQAEFHQKWLEYISK